MCGDASLRDSAPVTDVSIGGFPAVFFPPRIRHVVLVAGLTAAPARCMNLPKYRAITQRVDLFGWENVAHL